MFPYIFRGRVIKELDFRRTDLVISTELSWGPRNGPPRAVKAFHRDQGDTSNSGPLVNKYRNQVRAYPVFATNP